LSERLQAVGHDVVAPDLPYEDPRATYAERVAPALDALDGAGEPAVVVGHSLAAGYAPLVAATVSGARLVHLCPAPTGPFASAGAPMRASREGFPFPPDRPDGTSVWEPGMAIAAMYPRLAPATARAVAAGLRPGSSPPDAYPLTAPPDVPTSVVYARYDEFFDPVWSRWVAREVAGVEPIELDTGHFPMLEDPDRLAAVLLG
jgi:pimeloyl-ACP methyl ester carboxylesterase